MTRLAILVFFAAGTAVRALPDVTPSTPQLELTRGSTGLRGGTYTVDLLKVSKQRDGTISAWVRITKQDRDHGTLSMDQWLKVGESLGFPSKPDPRFRDRIPTRLLELLESENPVEFDPKAKLHSMRQYSDWPIRWCHLVPLSDGLGCMGFSYRRVPVSVGEIVLEERDGRQLTLQALAPGLKMPPDGHCTAHGGKTRARLLTEAERNLVRATNHLSEADEKWKSKNPKLRQLAKEG